MRAGQKRVFTIERQLRLAGVDPAPEIAVAENPGRSDEYEEIMEAIARLDRTIADLNASGVSQAPAAGDEVLKSEQLRGDLADIHKAITNTKRELASLYAASAGGKPLARVSDELSAIVEGTEQATETILSAVEQIDQNAVSLASAVKDQAHKDQAHDIQDMVVRIFEACNFQDLTGQRIAKVVEAFRFIDDRVEHMISLWGGHDCLDFVTAESEAAREGDKALLNGPALDTDENQASQSDIDALFD